MNSGTLNIKGINFGKFVRSMLHKGPTITSFTGGNAMIQGVGDKTEEGIGLVFATNVMGHYALLRNIESLMLPDPGRSSCKPMVVWMSSGTATSIEEFDFSDIEGIKSEVPYEHSKRLCEIIAAITGPNLAERGILTFIMSPGVCVSNIARNNILAKICIVLSILFVRESWV